MIPLEQLENIEQRINRIITAPDNIDCDLDYGDIYGDDAIIITITHDIEDESTEAISISFDGDKFSLVEYNDMNDLSENSSTNESDYNINEIDGIQESLITIIKELDLKQSEINMDLQR